MMRSMYSAVSGLKTHQTRMDVIGNNIANVNTVGFKSSSMTFQDMLYQNLSGASGPNATTGVGGTNAKQLGLGVSTGATNLSITSAGAAETTGRGFDIRLTDSSTTNFFIVNNGSQNLFTRAGSFYVDGGGNLCMTTTGYTVMGWQVDPTTGNIRKDTVSALRIMQPANMISLPEATTDATFSGIIDKQDPDVISDYGLVKNLNFYDKQGYSYTARVVVKATGEEGMFNVELDSILDADGNTVFPDENLTAQDRAAIFGEYQANAVLGTYSELSDGFYYYQDTNQYYFGDRDNGGVEIQLAGDGKSFVEVGSGTTHAFSEVYGVSSGMMDKVVGDDGVGSVANGVLTITGSFVGYQLEFSKADGSFIGINGLSAASLNLANMTIFPNGNFENISIDFSGLLNSANGGKSTAVLDTGNVDNAAIGKGKRLGNLIGLQVQNNGEIYGTYDNGNTVLLGQIAVAQFANAAGLEAVGNNCYATTLNSGEFDGVGVDITADGGKMTSGELEMSNVDLSSEFTTMITTQRGFQANSRVITVSDTLLEELVNLKR